MGIEWDDVRVFQTAVRAGDYSTAARKLDMDRTTVGRRFARLERAAGTALWEQGPNGYHPTAAGGAVLRAASAMERAMARLDDALDTGGGGLAGVVRLAGTAGLATLLLPALAEFLGRHERVSIDLVGARDAIAAVQQRHADIGIAVARAKPRDLAGARIAAFEQRRYARADGAAARGVAWGHAMMLANPQPWARLNAPAPDHVGLEVDGFAAMVEAVRAGSGAAWLWRPLGDRDPALRALADASPPSAAASLWVVHRADLAMEPAVTALRDAAADMVARFADTSCGG